MENIYKENITINCI